MITVGEAESIILSNIGELPAGVVSLSDALGCVLRESIHSDRDFPPFDRSTMDGICIAFREGSDDKSFKVAGTITAGQPKTKLDDPSSCFEIMTGAALPEGANCVIKVEDIAIGNGIATLNDGVAPRPGLAIHSQGSDAKKDDILIEAGRRITPKEIAILASVGKTDVLISKSPRIAILTTGDELVNIDQTPLPHQIRRSNDPTLAAALVSAGYAEVECIHISDDPALIDAAISRLLEKKDALIITGGISKGKKDFLPEALYKAGVEKLFQWVSQRPGKPFWFGQFKRDGSTLPVFALPGNPTSCFTCLHRYALPALDKWSGHPSTPPAYARLVQDFEFNPPLSLLLPVKIENRENSEVWASPLPFNTSGDFISVAQTHGFIELPADKSNFTAGQSFRYFSWQT